MGNDFDAVAKRKSLWLDAQLWTLDRHARPRNPFVERYWVQEYRTPSRPSLPLGDVRQHIGRRRRPSAFNEPQCGVIGRKLERPEKRKKLTHTDSHRCPDTIMCPIKEATLKTKMTEDHASRARTAIGVYLIEWIDPDIPYATYLSPGTAYITPYSHGSIQSSLFAIP
ncbi:hypothetical protein PG987_007274 [Apiospora arundinis]